jgi:hypothetical protein
LAAVGFALPATEFPSAHAAATADVVVRVPLTVGGSEPFTIELVNPGKQTERDRIPAMRALLASSPAFLATLPRVCDGGSAGGGDGLASGAAEVECVADALAVQLEATLVRQELATMQGIYWNLAGFFQGVAFGNEVNRMVQSVVQKVRPTLHSALTTEFASASLFD